MTAQVLSTSKKGKKGKIIFEQHTDQKDSQLKLPQFPENQRYSLFPVKIIKEPIGIWKKTLKPPVYNYHPKEENLHKKHLITAYDPLQVKLTSWIKEHVIHSNKSYKQKQENLGKKKEYPETSLIQRLDKTLDHYWEEYNINEGYIETGNPMIDIPRKNNRDEYFENTINSHAMAIGQMLKGLVEFDDYHEDDFVYKDLSYEEYIDDLDHVDDVEKLKPMHALLMIASSLVRAKREYKRALIRKPIVSNSQDVTSDFKKPNAETSSEYE